VTQTVRDVLARHDVSLTEEDVAETLERALTRLPSPAAAPLTSAEIDYLAGHAGPDTADALATWDPAGESAKRSEAVVAATASLVASTLGIEELARRLGVDRSRISHRISAGTLYSFTIGASRRRRIPAWQLTDNGLLPGLAEIVTAIPTGAHPLDVAALMATPQAELNDRTPVQHLAGGGDPQPVAELFTALGVW
jgi:hypothetical protein